MGGVSARASVEAFKKTEHSTVSSAERMDTKLFEARYPRSHPRDISNAPLPFSYSKTIRRQTGVGSSMKSQTPSRDSTSNLPKLLTFEKRDKEISITPITKNK